VKVTAATITLVAMLAGYGTAWAQDPAPLYPSKTIVLIDAQAPGGPADLEARLYAKKLTGYFGQNFIIDSKPAPGTTIASAVRPLGPSRTATRCQIVTGSFTIFPALYTKSLVRHAEGPRAGVAHEPANDGA
jgi:tripartite-type tricarboxylate transporter receptor subunit TctC